MIPHTLIVINDQAGSISGQTLEKQIQATLKSMPAAVRDGVLTRVTTAPEALDALMAQHHEHLVRVIAAGGDGTVTRVISAMLPYPNMCLGILPAGTGNRLASNLGIPSHLHGALETAFHGIPMPLDVGRINHDRYFVLMAGAGLDAEIMAGVHPLEKKTMGLFAYFWQALRQGFRTPYAVFEITVDDIHVRSRGIGVVVANAGNLLGPYFTLTPGAKPNDGFLDVCILAPRHRMDYWNALVQILSRQERGVEREGIKHLRGRRIHIRSRPSLRTQADGDLIGYTPMTLEAMPSAIRVMVPAVRRPLAGITDPIQHLSEHLHLLLQDLLVS